MEQVRHPWDFLELKILSVRPQKFLPKFGKINFMRKTKEYQFYDKVAKKFGSYDIPAKFTAEYKNGIPEEVFKKKLIKYGGENKIALDVGCGDGRFTLEIAPYFKKVIAIDLSTGMLKAARTLQKKRGVKNVTFEEVDVYKIPYKNELFDIAWNRRGPSAFSESYRVLKKNGYFIQIGIGEQDCRQIKEIFGRGQNFGRWDEKVLEKNKKELEKLGFKVIFAKEYFYTEYYPDYQNLNLFLQGVPIFTDFDSKEDREYLTEYVDKYQTNKGIKLSRHRTVIVARRPMENLLEKLRKLNLPKDKFAVYGSGPLGVRGIREIKDLDLIVTSDLWKELVKKYPTKDSGEKLRIDLGGIEILAKPIVYKAETLIQEADIIDGIRYVKLETLMELKKHMGRKKDFKDIELIKDYLAKTSKTRT